MDTALVGATRRRSFDRRRLESLERAGERARDGWHAWPSRGWPSTAAEEGAFVARLGELVEPGTPPDFGRRDVTAVVNALRCGLEVDELLRLAPGLVPARLLAAHGAVEARRWSAAAAWERIVAQPNAGTLAAFGPSAALALPVVVGRLAARFVAGDDDLARVVAVADREVRRVAALAASAEATLADPSTTPARRRTIGALLAGGDGAAIWAHDHHLPRRVGELVPLRLAGLLGERTSTHGRAR